MGEEKKTSAVAEEEGCLDGERTLVQRRKWSRVVAATARPPKRTTNCVGVELVKLLRRSEASFGLYFSAISNVSAFLEHGSLLMFATLEQRRMYPEIVPSSKWSVP